MGGSPTLPVLKRLLEAAGYRVEVRPEALVAVRSEDHRAFVADRARRAPADLVRFFPPDSVRRTALYADGPSPEAREEAARLGIELLDGATLGPALGELLLPSAPLDGLAARSGPDDDPLDAPFPLMPAEPRVVRPRIDRAEARELAGVTDARYTLRLVPYFVSAYRVRTISPDGGAGPIAHRLIAVNATTRGTEVWDEGERELDRELGAPAERFAPQIDARSATVLGLDAVRRLHAGRVDHTEQHSGALVIESRRVLPALENVRLGPMSLVYVPFWYAEGTSGRVVLDAVTGKASAAPDPGESSPVAK